MSASKDTFLELIGHETTVDIDKLRDIAFYGIPNELRGQVWLILLPALSLSSSASKSSLEKVNQDDERPTQSIQQTSQQQPQPVDKREKVPSSSNSESVLAAGDDQDNLTDSEILRVLKTELARYQRRNLAFKSTKMQNRILEILHGYLQRSSNARHIHHAELVHVVAPFAFLFKKESEASYCFQLMMRALDFHFGPTNGRKTLGRFLTLFRSRLPELFTHFEEEDVDASRWAGPWLQWLLCQLPFDCCLRLWDSYFAAPDGHGFALHTFVCLAILENCQTDLIELEHAELIHFLRHLPSLDMDRIIVQAQYLAHDFRFQ